MARTLYAVVLLLSLVAGFPCAAQDSPAPEPTGSPPGAMIRRLGWLAGCWYRETPTRIVEEQWMAPRGGAMLGTGRTVSKDEDRVIEFETTRIEERGDRLIFTAKPSGQSQASFRSIELTDSLVVFENPAHDFPQRVGYRLTANGGLAAWIEGKPSARRGAIHRRIDFPYERAHCP